MSWDTDFFSYVPYSIGLRKLAQRVLQLGEEPLLRAGRRTGLHGNMLGDSMYYGKGAGKLPTASAVVSDVIDCARHIGKVIMCFWDATDAKLMNVEEAENKFFFRVKSGNGEKVKAVFGEVKSVKLSGMDEEEAFVTSLMKEKDFTEKYEKIADICVGNRIRVNADMQ